MGEGWVIREGGERGMGERKMRRRYDCIVCMVRYVLYLLLQHTILLVL